MSAATIAPTSAPRTTLGQLSFPRVMRSEWIKLRSLRSTFWTLVSVLLLVAGLPLVASTFASEAAVFAGESDEMLRQLVINYATPGLAFAALVAAVLGVLAISGEFSTGMIRSSFAAVPGRIPVLAAKACVLFITTFAVAAIGFVTAWVVVAVVLGPKGYDVDLFATSTLLSIVGSAAFIALVSLFGLGLGAVLKASAGGIATALGGLFLLPILSTLLHQLLPDQTWISDVEQYLLLNVGPGMAGMENGIDPWQNVVTAVIWAVVPLVGGALLLKRRDA